MDKNFTINCTALKDPNAQIALSSTCLVLILLAILFDVSIFIFIVIEAKKIKSIDSPEENNSFETNSSEENSNLDDDLRDLYIKLPPRQSLVSPIRSHEDSIKTGSITYNKLQVPKQRLYSMGNLRRTVSQEKVDALTEFLFNPASTRPKMSISEILATKQTPPQTKRYFSDPGKTSNKETKLLSNVKKTIRKKSFRRKIESPIVYRRSRRMGMSITE